MDWHLLLVHPLFQLGIDGIPIRQNSRAPTILRGNALQFIARFREHPEFDVSLSGPQLTGDVRLLVHFESEWSPTGQYPFRGYGDWQTE